MCSPARRRVDAVGRGERNRTGTVRGIADALRHRLAIRYAIEGDLRFISHHDTLRLLERALVRARLPLRYSEGFNPRPRMSVALPRPVGVASSDELVVIEVTEPIETSAAARQLAPRMPEGLSIVSVEALSEGDRRMPDEAHYAAPLAPEQREQVARRAKELLDASEFRVTRTTPGRGAAPKVVDIRRFLLAVDVDEHGVRWRQKVTGAGSARIAEVLEALGLPAGEHLHEVRRERVTYSQT